MPSAAASAAASAEGGSAGGSGRRRKRLGRCASAPRQKIKLDNREDDDGRCPSNGDNNDTCADANVANRKLGAVVDAISMAAANLLLRGIDCRSRLLLQKVTKGCHMLENASFRNAEMQRRIVELGGSTFLVQMASLVKSGSEAYEECFRDDTWGINECVHAMLGLLVNLTHMHESACMILFHSIKENKSSAAELFSLSATWLRESTSTESPWYFDALLRTLSVLANCVEVNEDNRIALSSCTVQKNHWKTLSCIHFLVQELLRLFPGGTDASAGDSTPSWSAEKLVLSAHICLLLGCLLRGASPSSMPSRAAASRHEVPTGLPRNAQDRVCDIAALMPDHSLSIICIVLDTFVRFQLKACVLSAEILSFIQKLIKYIASLEGAGTSTEDPEPLVVGESAPLGTDVEATTSHADDLPPSPICKPSRPKKREKDVCPFRSDQEAPANTPAPLKSSARSYSKRRRRTPEIIPLDELNF